MLYVYRPECSYVCYFIICFDVFVVVPPGSRGQAFPPFYTDVWPAIGFTLLTQVCFCYCIKRLEMELELRFRAASWVG